MTTPEEFAPADASPAPIPAPPKKSHKAKPKPTPPPARTSTTADAPAPLDTPPQGHPNFGHKDPAVIRWHLARHPDRMAEIYGSFDWRKLLSLYPETADLED
jgi:hypothetical protein